MITLKSLWPWVKNRELIEENKTLRSSIKWYEDKTATLQMQLDAALMDAAQARKETIDHLKRNVNTLILAAGSRAVMFEDVGPHPPPRQEMQIPIKPIGKMRAGDVARESRRNYMAEFLRDQAAAIRNSEYVEQPPPEEATEETSEAS